MLDIKYIDKEFQDLDTQLEIEGTIKSLTICVIGGYAFLKTVKPHKDRTFTLDADVVGLDKSGDNYVPYNLEPLLNQIGVEYLNSKSITFSFLTEFEDDWYEIHGDKQYKVIKLLRPSLELLIVLKLFAFSTRYKGTDKADLYNPNLPNYLNTDKIEELIDINMTIENPQFPHHIKEAYKDWLEWYKNTH